MTLPETVVSGRVLNLLADGTQLDLVDDESFTLDPDESLFEWDPATLTTTQRIPGRNAPSFEFTSRIDRADKNGLQALGIVDVDGNYTYSAASRELASFTVEFLDADDGAVELEWSFTDVVVEFDGFDDENPTQFSCTVHVNGEMQIADMVTE